jgi:hypothetical protein
MAGWVGSSGSARAGPRSAGRAACLCLTLHEKSHFSNGYRCRAACLCLTLHEKSHFSNGYRCPVVTGKAIKC